MARINWTEVPGTGFHTADRGGFTIVRTSHSRWRLHRNGTPISIAYSTKAFAMAAAEDLLPDEEGPTAEPGEIVLTNPPPDPTAAAPVVEGPKGEVKLPKFIRVVRPVVHKDGRPVRSWL